MENNNTTIIKENLSSEKEKTKDKYLKIIDELNSTLSVTSSGTWLYHDAVGIYWKPNVEYNNKSSNISPPISLSPPDVVGELVSWGNKLDFENIPFNSVVIIRLNVNDLEHAQTLQQAITRLVLQPRIEIIKKQHVCVLFLENGDDVSIMTEAEMSTAGWVRKNPSRIIVP